MESKPTTEPEETESAVRVLVDVTHRHLRLEIHVDGTVASLAAHNRADLDGILKELGFAAQLLGWSEPETAQSAPPAATAPGVAAQPAAAPAEEGYYVLVSDPLARSPWAWAQWRAHGAEVTPHLDRARVFAAAELRDFRFDHDGVHMRPVAVSAVRAVTSVVVSATRAAALPTAPEGR